jgi:hypothetical protein
MMKFQKARGGAMERMNAPRTLRPFFDLAVRRTFDDLTIRDEVAAEYVADLLTRFARTEHLYPISAATGARLESVAELLLEVQRVWDLESQHFDPAQERELRRQIGDYTLFMTGLSRTLSDRFEGYAGALSYMRKVYFRPEFNPPAFPFFRQLITEW